MKLFIKNINKTLEFQEDQNKTLLEFLHENDINIKSNCEGNGVCGTCHLQFDLKTYNKFTIEDAESDVLDRLLNNSATSRLACRIKLTKELDNSEIFIFNLQ